MGRLGSHAADTAKLLLKHNLINCLASDAHHSYARTTDMTELSRYMERNFSQKYRDLLMVENPGAILEGRPLKMSKRFRQIE